MTTTRTTQGIARVVITIRRGHRHSRGMKQAASIIGPLLAAILYRHPVRHVHAVARGDRSLSLAGVTITLVSVFAMIAGFFLPIASSFAQLAAQVPEYQASIETTLAPVLSGAGIPVPSLSRVLTALSADTVTAVSGIGSGVTTMALITIAKLFLLFEVERFAARIGARLADRPGLREQFSSFGEKIVGYVVVRTEVNLVTGVGLGVVIAAVGKGYAAIRGFLAFAHCYIPSIAFWPAVIPPMLFAWSKIGAASASTIPIGAGIICIFAENVRYSRATGRGQRISPTVVFVSLVFRGLVRGSIGTLLAVPSTLALVIFLEFLDETRWRGALLSPSAVLKPDNGPEMPDCGSADPERRE